MGLRRDDFEWMLPSEYIACMKAWEEEKTANIKLNYEISRFNAWLCLQPNIKGNKTQADIFRFDWETELKTAKVKAWRGQPNTRN